MLLTRSSSHLPVVLVAIALASIGLLGCGAQREEPAQRLARLSDTTPSSIVQPASRLTDSTEGIDYDPWESFNQKTFWFNHDVLDRYALKPVATVWQETVPDPVRQSLANAFDNLAMPRRLVNKIFQGRFPAAASEVARFLINTTVGVAGFFDVATRVGLPRSDADAGQTLGVYGIGTGPYLVMPLLPPLTVRDGIGYAVDSLLDPLSYFITPVLADVGETAGKTVNERASNLKLYQDAEDVSLDLYAAVRNGYLQRRRKSIQDAVAERGSRQNQMNDAPLYAFPPAVPGGDKTQAASSSFAH